MHTVSRVRNTTVTTIPIFHKRKGEIEERRLTCWTGVCLLFCLWTDDMATPESSKTSHDFWWGFVGDLGLHDMFSLDPFKWRERWWRTWHRLRTSSDTDTRAILELHSNYEIELSGEMTNLPNRPRFLCSLQICPSSLVWPQFRGAWWECE